MLGIPPAKEAQLESELGDKSGGNKVFIIIVSNDPMYAGLGSLPSYPTWTTSKMGMCIVNADPSYLGFLTIHETGHSFADLDDEYIDAEYAASGDPYLLHPDRLNIKTFNPGGWLAGARYVADKYRYGNGLMRGVAYSFHSYNQTLVQNRINAEAISKISSSFTISNSGSNNSTFMCGKLRPLTKYHDGIYSLPTVGDKISIDRWGNPFNGGNKYYAISIGTIKINTLGIVTDAVECVGGM